MFLGRVPPAQASAAKSRRGTACSPCPSKIATPGGSSICARWLKHLRPVAQASAPSGGGAVGGCTGGGCAQSGAVFSAPAVGGSTRKSRTHSTVISLRSAGSRTVSSRSCAHTHEPIVKMRQKATRDFQATRPHPPPCKAQGRYEMRCDCAMRDGRRRVVGRGGGEGDGGTEPASPQP